MESNIKLLKTTFITASPFASFLSPSIFNIRAIESAMSSVFSISPTLISNYKSLDRLWKQTVACKSSTCGKKIALVTKDYLIFIDLRKNSVNTIRIPVLEDVLICNLEVSEGVIIISGLYQILIVNLEKRDIEVIDFSVPKEIGQTKLNSKQEKLVIEWRKVARISKTGYSGDFHAVRKEGRFGIKGVIAILYSTNQFNKLCEIYKEENKYSEDNTGTKYILHVATIKYFERENVRINWKALSVEYYISKLILKAKDNCLIVRADNKCEITIIALNSSKKFYSQLLLFNNNSMSCMKLRLIELILKNDTLPVDNDGKTLMTISDIQWTPNNLFAVVLFIPNYFCILSRLGQPLNILSSNSITHFFTLPIRHELFNGIKTTNKEIRLIGETHCASCECEFQLTLLNLWRVDRKSEKLSKIFQLTQEFPELCVNESILAAFNEAINKTLPYLAIQENGNKPLSEQGVPDESEFVNPFPLEPSVGSGEITKCGYMLIRAAEWGLSLSNNLLELMFDEMKSIAPLLYIKNESLCILHIIDFFEKILAPPAYSSIMDTSTFYTSGSIRELVETSIKSSFKFDKRKALLMLYYLIQFRNFKATSFNILYLTVAGVCKKLWKDSVGVKKAIGQIILILKANVLTEKEKTQNFFEMEGKTVIKYCSEMYQSMLAVCDGLLFESTQLTEYSQDDSVSLVSLNHATEERRDSSVETLLAFYDSKHMRKIIELINQEASGKQKKAKVTTLSKESFLYELYECIELINERDIDGVLRIVNKLISYVTSPEALIKGEYKEKRTLIVIVVYTCLVFTALALLKGCSITIREVNVLLLKILQKENPLKVLEQLKAENYSKSCKLRLAFADCPKERNEFYVAIGILLQLTENSTIIDLLLNSSEIVLAFLILNNKVNESFNMKKEEPYLQLLIDSTTKLKQLYPSILKEKLRSGIKLPFVISSCVQLSSRITGSIISYLTLPWLLDHIEGLWNFSGITTEQINKAVNPSNVGICESLKELLSPCGCSLESCKKVFARYFLNEKQAVVANHFLSEAVTIVKHLIKRKVLCCSSNKRSMHSIEANSELIPEKLSRPILKCITRLFEIIWKILLLVLIEENKDMVKQAAYILRLIHFIKDKNQVHNFQKQVLSLLKSVNYKELNVANNKESLINLGNALGVYIGNWEGKIQEQLIHTLSPIEANNSTVFEILKKHMGQKNNESVNAELKNDIMYNKTINSLKLVLSTEIEANVRNFVETCAAERDNLRRVVERINEFTGINNDTIIDRSVNCWTLKNHSIFNKENDSFTGSIKSSKDLSKLISEINTIKVIYITEDTIRYEKHLDILKTPSKNPLNTSKEFLLPPLKSSKPKLARTKKTSLEYIILHEKATNKIISVVTNSISAIFKRVANTDIIEALKRTGQPLVQARPHVAKHRKSYSFTTPDQGEIKPFSFYFIKKDQLGDLKIANKEKVKKTHQTNTEINTKLSECVS